MVPPTTVSSWTDGTRNTVKGNDARNQDESLSSAWAILWEHDSLHDTKYTIASLLRRVSLSHPGSAPPESRPAYVSSCGSKTKQKVRTSTEAGKDWLGTLTESVGRNLCVSELGNNALHNGESSSSLLVDGSGGVRGDRSGDVEGSGEGVHCKECEVLY